MQEDGSDASQIIADGRADESKVGDDIDDFETDSEVEKESDHEETDIRWKKPKNWDRDVTNK